MDSVILQNWRDLRQKFQVQSTKEIATIQLNFKSIFVALIVVFGYYGWGASFESTSSFLTLTSNLVLLFALLFLFLRRKLIDNELSRKIAIKLNDLLIFICILIVLLILNRDWISKSLVGDELAYAYRAQVYGYKLLTESRVLSIIENESMSAAAWFQIIAALNVLAIITVYKVAKLIRNDYLFFSIYLIGLFTMRLLFLRYGTTSTPNSPLLSFWLLLASSFAGVNDRGFRLGMMVLTSLILAITSRILTSNTKRPLVVFQIVLLLIIYLWAFKISVGIEVAHLTFLGLLPTLSYLGLNTSQLNPGFLYFLAFFTYWRTQALYLVVPCMIMYVMSRSESRIIRLRETLIPLAVIAPGLTTFTIGRRSELGFQNSETSVTGQITSTFNLFYNSGVWAPIVIALVCQIIFVRSLLVSSRRTGFLLVSVCSGYFVFFVLSELMNFAKYAIEFGLVLAIIMIVNVIIYLNDEGVAVSGLMRKRREWLSIVIAILFTYQAVSEESQIRNRVQISILSSGGSPSSVIDKMSILPLPYDKVFKFISDKGPERCLNVDITYGAMLEVMNGYSLMQFVQAAENKDQFVDYLELRGDLLTQPSAVSINSYGSDCAIVGLVEKRRTLIFQLRELGWVELIKFTDDEYLTSVSVLLRDSKL